jgi:predicted phage terminase large subunit-like protein
MGIYTYSAQILLNPKADALQGFQSDWIAYYSHVDERKLNKYLLVDAASSKKRGSDYTAMWIIGLGGDGNYYVLDMIRDRLNLKERADAVFKLHKRWKPVQTRYEKYGCMADIEHLESKMESETYRFKIKEVGGQVAKADRIKRLLPLFEQGKIYFPKTLFMTDWERKTEDLVKVFIEQEYRAFPVGLHDDMLDSLARICEPDLDLLWPTETKPTYTPPPVSDGDRSTAWMS